MWDTLYYLYEKELSIVSEIRCKIDISKGQIVQFIFKNVCIKCEWSNIKLFIHVVENNKIQFLRSLVGHYF